MVMVGVGNEDRDRQSLHLVAVGEKLPYQLLACPHDARSGVQKDGVVQDIDLDTGGIASNFQGRRPGDGDAAPNTPEGYGEILVH
jgi:hypothetical protein